MFLILFHKSFTKKFLFLVIIISVTSFAQKTDIIKLINGDQLTGELKQLQAGQLKLSTDNMGTIYISWNKISEIITDKFFEIELTDGRIYYGSFQPSKDTGMIIVKGVTLENDLSLKYIVSIRRIRESFWDILTGYIQLGASYNKGSKVGELNFGADLIYNIKTRRIELLLNSDFSGSEGNPTSKNQDIVLSHYKYLEKKWFWAALASVDQNTELGLNLRATLGGAFGNDIIQSNRNLLNLSFGFTAMREWYTDETNPENDIAGLITSRFQYFIYEHPGIQLYSNLSFLPYLTNWGRVRLNYTLSSDWEIIKDFYWDLSFYFSSDNEPQSENASKVDYSIQTGIKYNL